MKIKTLLVVVACLLSLAMSAQTKAPKREFRGAWIQCVNGQFQGMTPEKTPAHQNFNLKPVLYHLPVE